MGIEQRGRRLADPSASVEAAGLLQVVEAAQRGDALAREQLTRRTLRLALRTAAAVMPSREDAADVAQDAAIEVLRSLPALRRPERFDAWVYRISARLAVKAARRSRVRLRQERPLHTLLEDDRLPLGDTAEGAEEAIALRSALVVALRTLPPRQRVAIALRYVADLSEHEVAEAMGCRPGTAAALLSRARSKLYEHPALRQLHKGETS